MELEFTQWLQKNDNHLRGYAPNEVALLAFACGFKKEILAPGINTWLDRSRRLLRFWESPLAEKWMRVISYNRGIDMPEFQDSNPWEKVRCGH
jgi:hypothetical protein